MEKLQLESYGVSELDRVSKDQIKGGEFGSLILGISGALIGVYEVGKALGRELYYVTHD